MNIRRVYTPAIFIARSIDPSRGRIGAHDEYCKGVQPSNIHRKGYVPLDGLVYSPCDESLEGLHPSRIHRIHFT